MSTVLGIDIGTSYFSGAVWWRNNCYVIENDEYLQRIPSFVTYHSRTQQTVGTPAKVCTDELHKTFYNVKMILGRTYSDPNIQRIKTAFTYVVDRDGDDKPILKVALPDETLTLRPEDVHSSFIQYIKRLAEELSGQSVDKAVVAVPAYFDGNQRQATIDACIKAGIRVLQLINEPTAAIVALWYAPDQIVEPSNIIVFDMGSSSTKVTMVTIEEGATFGIRKVLVFDDISGNHFDRRIASYVIRYIRTRYNAFFIPSMRNVKCIINMAEESKIFLSSSNESWVEIEVGDSKYVVVVTRERLEQLCRGLLRVLKLLLNEVLKVTRRLNFKLDKVVMMGGASKMPMIRNVIYDFFGRELVLEASDTVVAGGAAIRAGMLTGQLPGQVHDLLFMDVLPKTLRLTRNRSLMMVVIKKGEELPCKTRVTLKLKHNDVIYVIEGNGLNSLETIGSMYVTGVKIPKPTIVRVTIVVTVYCIVNVTLNFMNTDQVLHFKIYANQQPIQ